MIALDTNVPARFFVDDPGDPEAARQRPIAWRIMTERVEWIRRTHPSARYFTWLPRAAVHLGAPHGGRRRAPASYLMADSVGARLFHCPSADLMPGRNRVPNVWAARHRRLAGEQRGPGQDAAPLS